MSDKIDDPWICHDCVSNERFAKWIRENGESGACDIDPAHSGTRTVVAASALAGTVDVWFRERYTEGGHEPYFERDSDSPSYEQLGEPYSEIMLEELGCDEEVVRAISEHLPDVSHRDLTQGDESFYDEPKNYESFAAIKKRDDADFQDYWFENRFSLQWQDFCTAAQYQRRFFKLKEPLDELFGNPKEYDDGSIRPVYMLPAGQKIYRARLLDDSSLEEKVQKSPATELGAPPKDRARGGRMNVEFIPAFYAAFSKETAVAEIRPGIGEVVAIGEFALQRDLKVFDFTAFLRTSGDGWKDAVAHTRYDFIDQMEGEISKPILPNDKQREYIPTQIVAEYLGEFFGCDAVIYRSSMIRDRDKESRNIVLLNKGTNFEGAPTSPLIYVSYKIERIANVTYTLDVHIPF